MKTKESNTDLVRGRYGEIDLYATHVKLAWHNLLTFEQEQELAKRMERSYQGILSVLCTYTGAGENGSSLSGLQILGQEIRRLNGTKMLQKFSVLEDKIATPEANAYTLKNPAFNELFEFVGYTLNREALSSAAKKTTKILGEIKKEEFEPLRLELRRYQKEEESVFNDFVRCNQRLVGKNAWFYYKRYQTLLGDFTIDDLIQEGNLGLINAIYKFDYRMDNRFTTIAVWNIRAKMRHAIKGKSKVVGVPIKVLDLLGKASEVENYLQQHLHRNPEKHEVAAQLGISVEELENQGNYLHTKVSVYQPIFSDFELTYEDTLKSDDPLPDQKIEEQELQEALSQLFLTSLKLREEDILYRRFGVGREKSQTLEEVGVDYGLTRERIRQIELRALQKIRHPERRKLLERFL